MEDLLVYHIIFVLDKKNVYFCLFLFDTLYNVEVVRENIKIKMNYLIACTKSYKKKQLFSSFSTLYYAIECFVNSSALNE